MEYTVTVTGPDPRKWEHKARQIRAELVSGLFVCTAKVDKDAKESIARGSKSGRTYEKYNPRRTHQASAPGEAPATDRGDLIKAIRFNVDRRELLATVSVNVLSDGTKPLNYAYELEFGNLRMAERPFMGPALLRNKPFIRERLAQAVNNGIRKP